MKGNRFQTLLKQAACLGLALVSLFTTAVTLSSCGGAGDAEVSRGSITYRQFMNGSKIIYLQAGSGFVLRGDPDLQSSGTQSWGYAFPAQLGIGATPGPEFQASFFGLNASAQEDEVMKGTVTFNVGFGGYSYSKETGFTAFLGFPSSLDPQLQLSAPLKISLNFDTLTWKTSIPDGSVVSWSNSYSSTYIFGEGGGSGSSASTLFAQEREGAFDIMGL